MHLKLLKFVYNGLLSGMPLIAYNPITKTPIHVPFTIKEQSTYINYKLTLLFLKLNKNHSYVDYYKQQYKSKQNDANSDELFLRG